MNYFILLNLGIAALTLSFSCNQTSESNRKKTIVVEKKSIPMNEIPKNCSIKIFTYLQLAGDYPDYVLDSMKTNSNTHKNEYYIDPFIDTLKIPSNLLLAGNRFKLIGFVSTKIGYPKYNNFISPNPTKWQVFKFYSYEIIKPYRIYRYEDEIFDENLEHPIDTIK